MFTAKHFNKLAEWVAELPVGETLPKQHQGKMSYLSVHYWVLLDSLCTLFQEENVNFDRKRFLKACDSPYFDAVMMGVPCEYRECRECGEEFVEPLDDNMARVCPKCERRWNSE